MVHGSWFMVDYFWDTYPTDVVETDYLWFRVHGEIL